MLVVKQPSTGFDGLLRRHHTEYAAQREESPARPCRRGAGPACLATPAVAVPSGHRKKKPMTDLLDYVVQAHGGLTRWNELDSVSAHLAQGGVTWEMKGQKGVLDDVFVTATLHEEQVSHHPFGAAGLRSVFTPERVTILSNDGTVAEELNQPRASFAGHTLQTPWTTPQLAYFAGAAMWTYLTQPFTFTLPGFETAELEPWHENGEQWRRLRVTWPGNLAGLSQIGRAHV